MILLTVVALLIVIVLLLQIIINQHIDNSAKSTDDEHKLYSFRRSASSKLLEAMMPQVYDSHRKATAVVNTVSSGGDVVNISTPIPINTVSSGGDVVNIGTPIPNSIFSMLSFSFRRKMTLRKPASPAGNSTSAESSVEGVLKTELKLAYGTAGYDDIFSRPANQLTRSDLFIGFASYLDSFNVAVMCRSLRKYNADAHIILILEALDPEFVAIFKETGTLALMFSQREIEPVYLRSYNPSTLRWVVFDLLFSYKFNMKDHGHSTPLRNYYKRIMCIDARDTAFQGDPFSRLPSVASGSLSQFQRDEAFLYTFGEQVRIAIRDCGWNSKWLLQCFGQTALDAIGGEFVICSGVVVGSTDMIAKYLRVMARILTGESEHGLFSQCESNGVDQGTHNYVIYNKLVPGLEVKFEESDPQALVVHMQSSPVLPSTRGSGDGKDVYKMRWNETFDGFEVVHQYDRYENMIASLQREFIPDFDLSNVTNVFNMSKGCSNYSLYENTDLFRGSCDKGSYRVMSIRDCCSVCNSMGNCRAFAFSRNVCYFKVCASPADYATTVKEYALYTKLVRKKQVIPPELMRFNPTEEVDAQYRRVKQYFAYNYLKQ